MCHDAVPTLTLLHHRKIAPSATCTRCGDHEETFLHCVRDCRHSKIIWHKVGFLSHDFFSTTSATEWIRNGTNSSHSILFLVALWWVWRNRNLTCLNNETWSLYYLVSNIYNSVDTIISALKNDDAAISEDRYVKWNCNNHMDTILNVDGSCNGTPTHTGFGGIFRNNGSFFLSTFLGMISHS